MQIIDLFKTKFSTRQTDWFFVAEKRKTLQTQKQL